MTRAKGWLRAAVKGWRFRDWLLLIGIAGASVAVLVQIFVAARHG